MKNLKLSIVGKNLLDATNALFEQDPNTNYHKLTAQQKLICDLGMYVEGDYGINEFENIEDFALEIASEEYQDPEKGKDKIIRKINKAIKQDLVSIELI
jgi:uncharacterized protein YwgA